MTDAPLEIQVTFTVVFKVEKNITS